MNRFGVHLYTSLVHININTLLLTFIKWVPPEIISCTTHLWYEHHTPGITTLQALTFCDENGRRDVSHCPVPTYLSWERPRSEKSQTKCLPSLGAGCSCTTAIMCFTIWCGKEDLGLDLQCCQEPAGCLGETTSPLKPSGSPSIKWGSWRKWFEVPSRFEGKVWNPFHLHALRVPSLETFSPFRVPGSGLVLGGCSPHQQASLWCHWQN